MVIVNNASIIWYLFSDTHLILWKKPNHSDEQKVRKSNGGQLVPLTSRNVCILIQHKKIINNVFQIKRKKKKNNEIIYYAWNLYIC